MRGTLPASISLDAGNDAVNRIRTVIRETPVAKAVISQQGRPDDGTDATGFFNAEFFVPLKPLEEWPKGLDKDILVKNLSERLAAAFPGVEFSFSQAIADNIAEAVSGIKGQNAIKLFGSDLASLTRTAAQIKATLATVEGVTDLAVSTSLGQPTVRIDIDRAKAGRYGLSPGDVNTTIQVAIGGQAAGAVYERSSDRYYPILVRLAPEYRKSLAAIRQITIGVTNPNGGVTQIPLSEVATVDLVSGAAFIYREGQERYVPIRFSVRGRDLGSAVLEAQEKVAQNVQLPPGYRIEWVGEFNNFTQAIARLKIIVPITLLLIAVLLYVNFNSIVDTLLALSVIPMAVIGGVFALVLTGTPFSISAAIGFIALFGIATMEGVILLSYYNQTVEMGLPREQAVLQACSVRLRPVMMTCVAACVGLLPAALSTAIGSQVQRPLALVVVGGILLAPALVLLVLPVLIALFSRRTPPRLNQALEAVLERHGA